MMLGATRLGEMIQTGGHPQASVPSLQFARHCRNACAHGDRWEFRGAEPKTSATCGHLTLSPALHASHLHYLSPNRKIDLGDEIAVQIGVDLHARYGPGQLKPEHVQQAIMEKYAQLAATGKILEHEPDGPREPYIAAVAHELGRAGITCKEWFANPDEPREGVMAAGFFAVTMLAYAVEVTATSALIARGALSAAVTIECSSFRLGFVAQIGLGLGIR